MSEELEVIFLKLRISKSQKLGDLKKLEEIFL
jgi:hypothetical protein